MPVHPVKARILVVAISAFTLWPLVQMGLVATFDVNPWKLGGWGMYSAPRITPEIEVAISDGTGPFRWLTPRALQRYKVAPQWVRLVRTRRALGRLSPPDPVAEALFASDARIVRVRIRISQPRIDLRTAIVEIESETFDFERH
jgi:hypothetical protein